MTFCQLEDEAAFTCSADRTIRKWDVLNGQCLQVFRGHTSIVNRSAWLGTEMSSVGPLPGGTWLLWDVCLWTLWGLCPS